MFYHNFDDKTIDMFDKYYERSPHMYKRHEKYYNNYHDQYTYFANHYVPEDYGQWVSGLDKLYDYERHMYAKIDIKDNLLVISYYQFYNTNITLINRYIEDMTTGMGYHYSLKQFKSVGYVLYASDDTYHMGGWTDYDRFYKQRQRRLDNNSIGNLRSLERFRYLPIDKFKFISVYKLFQVGDDVIYQYELLLKSGLIQLATELHQDRTHISKPHFIKYKREIMSGIKYQALRDIIHRDERKEEERKEKLKLRTMIAAFDKLPKVKWEYEDYIFKTPESYEELKKEGRELHHCVASYVDKIIGGEAKVILMRKKDNPEKPYYTIELQDDRVIQVRTEYNKSDEHITYIVKKWADSDMRSGSL